VCVYVCVRVCVCVRCCGVVVFDPRRQRQIKRDGGSCARKVAADDRERRGQEKKMKEKKMQRVR